MKQEGKGISKGNYGNYNLIKLSTLSFDGENTAAGGLVTFL